MPRKPVYDYPVETSRRWQRLGKLLRKMKDPNIPTALMAFEKAREMLKPWGGDLVWEDRPVTFPRLNDIFAGKELPFLNGRRPDDVFRTCRARAQL